MCGYDPFAWYEQQLDREYQAQQAGYDTYEEYYEAMQDYKENIEFDKWHEEQTIERMKI